MCEEKKGEEKKAKTKMGQPGAQIPGQAAEEASEEKSAEAALPASQPSPSSSPGAAPSTPEQTSAEQPAVATPAAPPQPLAQPTPSQTEAETRQIQPRKGWKPGWWKKADRWARQNTALIVMLILWFIVWNGIIISGYIYRSELYHGAKAKVMIVGQMVTPAKKVTKPTLPPPTSVPPVIKCNNYTATRELDGSISVKNCECRGDNCPVKIVCKGDQYKVTPNWKTITNPDDTEQRFVENTVVDTSNCERFY
jgi:hypothetical protein